MAFELGVLMGTYGGAMSFEHISSWTNAANGMSLSLQSTDVHSSENGCQLDVYSRGGGLAVGGSHAFMAGASYGRLTTEVTTHAFVGYMWARARTAATSGTVSVNIGISNQIFIPHVADPGPLSFFRSSAPNVSSNSIIQINRGPITGSASFYVDDMLALADVVELNPTWEYREHAGQVVTAHRTIRGQDHRYIWGNFRSWSAPVRHVPSSLATLINEWWRRGWLVGGMTDTSDEATTFVGRVVGGVPFTSMNRPYTDRYSGTIEIEAVHNGLDF